jgi:hypothetical protein
MDVLKTLRKLNILKSYSSLLVPIIISVIGVLVFIPTRLMNAKLQNRMAKESITVGRNIGSLSNNPPPRDQWKLEQEYQIAFERDAKQTALLAKQSAQREILSYKIFPEMKGQSTLVFEDFGKRYCVAVDELIGGIHGRDCPTREELKRGLQSSTQLSSRRSGGSLSLFSQASSSKGSKVDAMIRDFLCQEKAELASVYVNPADLSGYQYWGGYKYADMAGMKEAVEDCWYWQLGYWIIEDVIETIGLVNSGSNSVFTSPVKRLISVNFTPAGLGGFGSSKKGSSAKDRPSYILSVMDGLAEPWSGRLCNNDIDVVQFGIDVVVSAKAVLPFMQQLCSAKEHKFRGYLGQDQQQVFKHNQISILQSEILPVDRQEATHELYRYGEDAVVELDLICEYIFNKVGYEEIKPKSIQEMLKTKLGG